MKLILLLAAIAAICACQEGPSPVDLEDEEEAYFADYSRHMTDFQPTEAFSIQLAPYEFHEFLVACPNRSTILRGLYYVDAEDPKQLILVTARQNNRQLFTANNRRMHIFSTNETQQGSITFQIKNTDPSNKTLYFSYETTAIDRQTTTKATNDHFKPLFAIYNSLFERIQRRDFMIRTMVRSNQQHTRDLVDKRSSAVHYALVETVVLAATFGVSMAFIYRNVRRRSYSVI